MPKVFLQNAKHNGRNLFEVLKLIGFIIFSFVQLATITQSEPIPINLFSPTGKSDIVQLWDGEDSVGVMRNALKPDSQNRWINYKDANNNYVIPYVIEGSFTAAQLRIIQGAMDAISENTCITFRKRNDEFDYIAIQNKEGEGCYTMVGRTPGKNVVMLEGNSYATCVLHPTVVHELMHSIGLWHEQMRYDRDKYIRVHYENVPKAMYAQFKKVPQMQSETYGVKYDYNSVMHYTKDAFAMLPGEITMETKDQEFQDIIGHAETGSPGDYIKICSIYKCAKCMGKPFTGNEEPDTFTPVTTKPAPAADSGFGNLIGGIFGGSNDDKSADSADDSSSSNDFKIIDFGGGNGRGGRPNVFGDFSTIFAKFFECNDEPDRDQWANNWLEQLHKRFPDLSDTWSFSSNDSPHSDQDSISVTILRTSFDDSSSSSNSHSSSSSSSNENSMSNIFSQIFGR